MSEVLAWTPFDPALMGDLPPGVRCDWVVPTADDLPAAAGDVEFFVPAYEWSVDWSVLARMPRLRVVQALTAGVDHVRPWLPEGVELCSGRGIHDASTAELAVALMLASLRGVPDYVRAQSRHDWDFGHRPALADKRVLIVGYGAIGAALEARLAAFEVEIVRVARTARAEVHGVGDLPALVADADVVVVVVPLTEDTRHLIDADLIGRMRPGALLVNVARGPVVDTDALLEALHEGRITAAIDVVDPEPLPADHPLWDAPGLLITPHIGGSTSALWPRAYRLVREQLARYAAGEPLANRVTGAY